MFTSTAITATGHRGSNNIVTETSKQVVMKISIHSMGHGHGAEEKELVSQPASER